MNKFFTVFIQILVSLFTLRYSQCKTCPSITTSYNPKVDYNYVVRSFLKIPYTNVLIINAYIRDSEGSSVVYYNDMQSPQGEIINVILPDYAIIEMSYMYKQDKIFAMNHDRIVIANPYTLKSERYLTMLNLVHAQMIDKLDIAITTSKQYTINIIDTNLLVVKKTLDNNKFQNVLNTLNYFTKYFQRQKPTQFIFITVNSYGFFSWTVDLDDFSATYNDYIGPTIVNGTGFVQRPFVKHPSKDIFFVGGTNLEILAFEIVDITTQTYRTQMKLNLINSTNKLNITNIVYKSSTEKSQKPLLIAGDGSSIYDLVLDFDDTNKIITIPEYQKPPQVSDGYKTNYTWYEIPEQQDLRIIMSANSFVTLYNYYNQSYNYNLFFGTNWISRRFMYEGNEQSYYAILRDKSVDYFNKNNLANLIGSNTNLTYTPYSEVNNFYRVKKCEECLIIKTAFNKTHNHFMDQIFMYPLNNNLRNSLNISSLGFKWSDVNLNLDPFYYNNQIWVVLGFRNKTADKKFLFTLINMYDTKQNVLLTGATDEENSRQSSYALASIDNPDNLEIIGVGNLGYIYVWDFLKPQSIKYSKQTSISCLTSVIGVLYQYNKKKWLILACDNTKVLSYDFENDTTIQISKLATNPLSLRAFPSSGIITIGDTITGNVYIHKFNDGLFSYFLTIQSGSFKDSVISVQLLKDKTIWIQYYYSNIFYSLGDCLDDVNKCQNCEQTHNFNAIQQLDSSITYGNGSTSRPYTSAFNFLTAILAAYRYKDRISGVTSMNVNIVVDPLNVISLPKGFLNFDFSSIIQLSIKSKIENQLATLEFSDKLDFSNYNYVGLQDIKIQFNLIKTPNECGINFYRLSQNATISNIQLQNKNLTDISLNCFQIYAEETNIKIQKISIQDQDFSSHTSIFSTLYAEKVDIQNLSLKNCLLGDKFSIVKQNSNLNLTMKSISITNNKCSQDRTKEVSSLFSAGLFNVDDLQIQNNNFCNKIIFSSVASLEHQNYAFQFNQVQVLDNSFIAKTSYLFFNSLYSMRQKPSHKISFKKMSFQKNTLIKTNQNDDLMKASLIQTSKISNHEFLDITFKNHHEISFSQIEYSDLVQINKFYCINDKEYLNSSPNSDTGSCLQLFEIFSINISNIKIKYKKAYNNELISLQNKLFYSLSDFNIIDGEFQNMQLMQYSINSFANPITVQSQNNLTFIMSKCNFFDNSLEIIGNSQTLSTSALWIENSLGSVNITESTFKNSSSNSIYNFMFIQTIQLELHNISFSSSSFGLDQTKHLGGFMNLIVNTLKVVGSSFSKSKSQYGSFMYLEAFGYLLNVDISKTNFTEGYAEVDGGAIFIDIKKSKLKLTFTDCIFNNIYTYSQGSSIIGFQKYRITTDKIIHEMICQGGSILSTFGLGDNFFVDIFNMKLSLIDIKEIRPLITNLNVIDTSMNKQFGKTASQQSTLVSSQYSEINIKGCRIKDFQNLNSQSKLPLFITSEFTTVSITDTSIQDGIFVSSAIKVTNGTLTFKNTQFTNFTQFRKQQQRYLLVSEESSNNGISSLIIMKDSSLKVLEQTQFNGIKCYNNCTGSVFYLMNANIDIQNMLISNSQAAYGGSIYIQGIKQSNQIISSKFENNLAQIDGGVIYLQALQDNKFDFIIDKSEFLSNIAQSGKGGALFIRSNSQNSTNQIIEISDTQIIGNTAQIGGGIYQKEISPKIKGSIFKQNVGKTFGNDTLSYPTHLRLASMSQLQNSFKVEIIDRDTIFINDFRSGDTLKSLSFELVNDQDEVIRPITVQEQQNFAVQVQVGHNQNFQNYSIRGNVSTTYDNKKSKQFLFQDFDFIGIPGTQATLEFFSDQIYILDGKNINQYNKNYTFKILINFRKCIQGEAITEYGFLTECIICQQGKYSFDLQECHSCPNGATCAGGSQMIANQGYWRNNNESTQFISCPLMENCIGGSFGSHVCYEGHIGALCDECDIRGDYWDKSYTKSAKNSCTDCDQIAYNTWFVLLVTLWTLASMALAIKGDIQAKLESGSHISKYKRQSINTTQKSQIYEQNMSESIKNIKKSSINMKSSSISYYNETPINLQRSKNLNIFRSKIISKQFAPAKKQKKENTDGERSSIYIKILTNYFQIVSSVATFNLNIPSGIFGLPASVGQPLKNTLNNFDCFLKDFETQIPFIYFRQIISFLIPVVYFLIFVLGLAILQIYNRKGRFPYYILSTAAMFLIIYIQPDLVSQLIALVSCRQVGDTSYILANLTEICYTSEHSKYALFFIFPALTVWVLVLPLFLFAMLYKNRNNLSKIKIKMTYGFLYKEYKKEAFYWEFMKMVEKICIILSLNFYYTTVNVKAFLVFVIIVVYGILSIIIEPFEDENINSLDNYSTTVCALSVLLGLFIYQNPFPYFYFSSLAIIVIINAIFIFTILKRIINVYLKRLEKILENILIKLALKIPQFKTFLKNKQESKKVNPLVKEKVKKIFDNYLIMSDEEKQKTKIKILKSSFKYTLSSMFGDHDEINNSKNQKSLQYQYANNITNQRKFSIQNSSEEQNNLLQQNQNQSPVYRPLYSIEDSVNDEEKAQQRKSNFRLSLLSQLNNFDDKCQERLFDSEQSELHTEETKENFIKRNKYLSIKNKLFNIQNNQETNEDLVQVREEDSNQSASYNQNIFPLNHPQETIKSEEGETQINEELNEDNQEKISIIKLSVSNDLKSENEITQNQQNQEKIDDNIIIIFNEDQIKANEEENEDTQQKRAQARLSVLDAYKSQNEITLNTENQENIEISVKKSKSDSNINQPQEIKSIYSQNNEMADYEGAQVIEIKEESQTGVKQIDEKTSQEIDNHNEQSNNQDNDLIQFSEQNSENKDSKNDIPNNDLISFSEQDIDNVNQDSFQNQD